MLNLSEEAVNSNSGLSARSALKFGLLAVLIIAVCTAVFITNQPALSAKALSFDDNRYFVENFLVRSPSWESARRFLTEILEPSTVGGYYQPLTMISLMLDYAIGGQTDSLMPFHRTSLIIHIANTALIIILLYQLFGKIWLAAGVGLLFGVHPLAVETIAWVGERKTLLAAFFSFWSLIFYVYFSKTGCKKSRICSIIMYLLALMSKPTSTPLPVVMLLFDYWPLKRLCWRTIFEKWPYYIIGGISAVITYISQSRTASIILPESYGAMRAPLVICHNIIFYLLKMVCPINQSSHYAFPNPLNFSVPMVKIGVIGTFILLAVLLLSWRWTRAALTGWLIFFIMVFPTMQTLQFSDVIASDKFVYLPSIGILLIIAAFIGWVCRTSDIRKHYARYAAVAIIILLLAGTESFATRRYLADWQTTASLFAHMTKVTPNAVSPYNNMGAALAAEGDIKGAIECFEKVIKIRPDDFDAYINLGKIYADQGKYDQAMPYYNKALQLKPDEVGTYVHMAVMLTMQGRIDEATAMYRKAIALKLPHSAPLHIGLGTLLLQQGKLDEGIYELDFAVKLKPDATTYNNLGVALGLKGRIDEAIQCHKKAIQLNPANAEAHYNLGNILLSQNKNKQAISEYENAVRINPKYTKAHINLAVALMNENRLDEAIKQVTDAVKIEPNNVDAHYNLAVAMESKGQTDEALNHFARTIELQQDNIDAHYGLAKALALKGRLQEAADEYRQVLMLDPQDADVHCFLGNVLVKLDKLEEAANEYDLALKINPQHSEAQKGLNSLFSEDANQTTK